MTTKKTIKRVMALLCALGISFTLAAPSFAAKIEDTAIVKEITSTKQVTDVTSTTERTQAEYEADLQMLARARDTESSIQAICELFIASIYASQQSPDYDCLVFTKQADQTMSQDGTLAYIESKNRYMREINRLCDYNVVRDNIQFADFIATVTGNTCTAEIAVHYSYELTGRFDTTCYENCMYYLTLEKGDNGWRVLTVKTSMPQEQSAGFVYEAFDAQEVALAVASNEGGSVEVMAVEEAEQAVQEDFVVEAVPGFVYKRTAYSPSAAVAYAKKYYNVESDAEANPLFGYNEQGGNCQNFASQCVWAGLLAGCHSPGTVKTALPAISTAYAGSSAPNIWCQGQESSYYENFKFNWAWDNVNGFLKLILESDHTQEGPQGSYWVGLDKASVGDVIAWDEEATRSISSGSYEHAMFVTEVAGTYRSRGVADISVAANSPKTEVFNVPLARYNTNYTKAYYATAHISGGYYLLSNATVNRVHEPVME